ncbi:PEPKR2, partial [Symbiodinium pilosum]
MLQLLALVAFGAVRAELGELAADDECTTDGCALSALHLRSSKRSEMTAQEESAVDTGCHDIREGEGGACWEAIMWGKNVGMPQHPDWYPGMTEDSPLSEWQFKAWNTTHPKCPRPCSVPAPGGCVNVPAPKLWKPAAAGGNLEIKVLSYNLFWWHLFKVEGGRGDSAGHLIQNTASPPYDVMGFQECEDPVRVLGHVGLLEQYEAFQGKHAICVAYRKAAWSLLEHGETDVAEDMRTEYYGTRGTQWLRLQHKGTGRKLFFVNHHGPLSVNSGGLCGGEATAHKILHVMARHGQVGDTLVLVGDFNANAASRTVQAMWPHLHHVYNSQSFGGVDNIFANLAHQDDVVETKDIGSGGSDHHAISAIISVGPRPPKVQAAAAPKAQMKSLDANCHTAAEGDGKCWEEVHWAMSQGIYEHPEWYQGLEPSSSVAKFQAKVYMENPGKCPRPCGIPNLPNVDGPTQTGPMKDGSKFSVEVLDRAQGSDSCLLEPQTEYAVAGGWYQMRKGIQDPRVCCQLCQQQGQCKA